MLVNVVGVLAGFNPLTVTVYIVVTVGDTTMVWVVNPPGFQEKVGLVNVVFANMVAGWPAQMVALVTGTTKLQLVDPDPDV